MIPDCDISGLESRREDSGVSGNPTLGYNATNYADSCCSCICGKAVVTECWFTINTKAFPRKKFTITLIFQWLGRTSFLSGLSTSVAVQLLQMGSMRHICFKAVSRMPIVFMKTKTTTTASPAPCCPNVSTFCAFCSIRYAERFFVWLMRFLGTATHVYQTFGSWQFGVPWGCTLQFHPKPKFTAAPYVAGYNVRRGLAIMYSIASICKCVLNDRLNFN